MDKQTRVPNILVTNDDGITAPGIRFLVDFMADFGNVYVVAPDKPQSGKGHAITISSTLHSEELFLNSRAKREWNCSGTPADCVKLAISELLPEMPDLCVSGINHGTNASINILYSGTMSAAVEAGLNGITAIGISLSDFSYNADFNASKKALKKILTNLLAQDIPKGMIFNINIPKAHEEEIKGAKICRQGAAVWEESFDKRIDPRGKEYYWLTGHFKDLDLEHDTDTYALSQNFISIVPVQFDLTNHKMLEKMKKWEF